MPDAAIRALMAGCAIFALCWARPRLDCLFYSAFEYSQAALIDRALPAPLRVIGLQDWLYSHFFTRFHAVLLGLWCSSVLTLILQSLPPRPLLYGWDACYLGFLACSLIFWRVSLIEGQDHRAHAPYNTFAPLHIRQRRELNAERNAARPSRLLQRMDIFRAESSASVSDEDRARVEARFRKY